ncbi:MAG TPA: methyl-accepting chemotaxis protein [Paenibacillus sp.]|uniref:methyl-accepting chemotaxis protein n=1 Tax=Paenibacillus TaxID=44249 RepID=UPI000BA0F8FC|nr:MULTISPECIES: methyl-accepting chemotaxis protein [Paenibacillus]OZQ61265.1 chemotaxis protein [Paenibacillus taichungensis]HBU80452.1 methyl-accepting chemotaxis protein [Paenibacillus sp.]
MKTKIVSILKMRSLRTKLVTLCLAILIVPTIVIGFTSYTVSKNEMNESGKAALENSVSMVIGMINLLNEQVESGDLTLEQAQEKLRVELLGEKNADNKRPVKSEYTVGETGYPWAVDKGAHSVMNPSNEGQDLTDVVTEDGVYLGKELVNVGSAGGGFVTYKWALPDTGEVETKVSYVEMDPHWGWIIGSGAYLSEFNSGATQVLYLVIMVTAVAVVLGSVIVSIVSGRLTKPILKIAKRLKSVADGDLTVEEVKMKSKDEIGELSKDFNEMIKNMRYLIKQVDLSTKQVASSSKELNLGAEHTSQATENITISIQESAVVAQEQQMMLQRTTNSLEEISIGIQRIAESSSTIADSSVDAMELANIGSTAIEHTAKQMNLINNSVNETDVVMRMLDERSQQIGTMLHAITDIANQTNLLALNASIEAARAGEEGRGFSVVASEVRKLAEQSNQSSGQISTLIHDMRTDIEQSLKTLERVKQDVDSGIQIASETEQQFNKIVGSTNFIAQQTEELASVTQQITASVQEITAGQEQVSNLALQAADNSQNIAASSEEQLASMEQITSLATTLSDMSQQLERLTIQFKY